MDFVDTRDRKFPSDSRVVEEFVQDSDAKVAIDPQDSNEIDLAPGERECLPRPAVARQESATALTWQRE